MVRYSDTDNRKGRKQLRLNLPPPRQISTLLRRREERRAYLIISTSPIVLVLVVVLVLDFDRYWLGERKAG